MAAVVNDPVADIVADVVATTRRGSRMYSRNRFRAPWGAAFPAGNLASFHVITTGACWLTVDGEPARPRGDDMEAGQVPGGERGAPRRTEAVARVHAAAA